jgi:hypothetical protein
VAPVLTPAMSYSAKQGILPGAVSSATLTHIQLSAQSLQVNSFAITATWYFSRDNSVPVKRQIRLTGPSSTDQTKTAKVH